MRLLILSDLHNEFGVFQIETPQCHAVILSGDTDVGISGALWAVERIKNLPIIYIAGNHEYYGKKLTKINQQLRALSEQTNLFFLEKDEQVLEGVRFLGCTLWTDFRLHGDANTKYAIYQAQNQMTDYKRIRLGPDAGYRKLRPADTILYHHQSVKFLEQKLRQKIVGATVVITHHAPSSKSLPAQTQNDILNPSYASDLEWLVAKYQPDLWIHGHIHQRFNYPFGKTRVICNPRGYFPDEITPGFQSDFVVEIV
ncbi:MAG: metallophosphoesterase [bacterium]